MRVTAVNLLKALKSFFGGGERTNLPIVNVEKRFELIGRVGQGSMSKVWRARDRESARTVCLKVLDKDKTAKFEARFVGLKRPSEGTILSKLRHPNIVLTTEHGLTTKKEQYIIMELIEGNGLNFLVETKSPVVKKHKVNILLQLADAVEFTHNAGFLHRDICPRNVMVTTKLVVKLIDFGLAVPYTPDFCKPGNRTGTTNYLAPELIKRLKTDHRVDMFALGATAYELFTGDLPWEKAASMQVLTSMVNSPARDPRELCKDLDDATVNFLKKAVEQNPGRRFQNPAEFRDALKEIAP